MSPPSIINTLSTTNQQSIIIAIDHKSNGPNYSILANQFNIIQSAQPDLIIDHLNPGPGLGLGSLESIKLAIPQNTGPIKLSSSKGVAYSGLGHYLNRSPLVLSLGHAHSSAYDPHSTTDHSGSAINLVSAIQLKNNNRLIWSGSTDLFSNKLSQV